LFKDSKAIRDLLDVGAGFGNNTAVLLGDGNHVTALETNPEAVKTQ
jgi:16S rRNA A1518/A1519 N6-dimethyltransferase RsmA/KsgA/DIM1 with predicted DNA glycosylase/AP lyase activity